MSFQFILLILVCSSNCNSKEITEVLCNDIKHVFETNQEKSITLYTYKDFPSNDNMEQFDLVPNQFVFENKIELLLSKIFQTVFEKLVDLRNSNLNQVILKLSQEKPLRYEYYFLKQIELIYNTRKNKEEEVKQLLQVQDLSNQNYSYFDKELKRQTNYLICAFLTLANFTNNYDSIKELLQPLEIILEDEQSSSAMLIFINKFLTEAMEGHDTDINIYRKLFLKYVINQLQTVESFNVSDLLGIQNKNNSENVQGILTLFLNWRVKIQDVLPKNDSFEYFHILDQTFREVSKARNAEINVISSRSGNYNRQKLEIMKNDRPRFTRHRARVQRLFRQVKAVLADKKTSAPLSKFAQDFFKKVNSSHTNLMPTFYNYMANELNTIEPFNASIFKNVHNLRMEELAAILHECIINDPGSINTMALEWLFTLKIEMLRNSRNANVFDSLRNTMQFAKDRRRERLKKNRTVLIPIHSSQLSTHPVEIDKDDEEILHKASYL